MNRVVSTPSDVKVEMPLAFKRERKGSSLAEPKPIPGEARGELRRQNTIVGSGVQSHILATARLSAQCQLRHFNPKWHETSGPGGFKCSVQLLNKMIHGEHVYSTAYDAKQAAAEKALVYVRRLPCKDPAEKIAVRIRSAEQTDRYCDRNRQGRAQGKKEPTESTSHTSFHGQHTYAAPPGDNAATYTWNTYNYNEQRAFLHRIQSLFGGSGPSPAVLSDPLAAQAFLQGLAVGTSVRAAGLAYDPYLEPQGRPVPTISGEIYRGYDVREQSPARDFSRNYRGRSPPPRRMP
ncbi:hypothetical protein F4825DRAFT_48977 [Nemania diffusa]|nr:hypothetical protein F4825DRAFT_48977 [Nemania diffusa]